MSTLLQILQLLPSIMQAVTTIEQIVNIPGAGQQKLDLVLNTVLAADKSAANLVPVITTVIGNIVSTMNAVGIFKKNS